MVRVVRRYKNDRGHDGDGYDNDEEEESNNDD